MTLGFGPGLDIEYWKPGEKKYWTFGQKISEGQIKTILPKSMG